MLTKYKECLNPECKKIHVVIANVDDDHPTCMDCENTEFKDVMKGKPGYMPPYCDQYKDKRIWDGVMAVILGPIYTWGTRMEKKHNIHFSKNDIQDLALSITVVSKVMINWTRGAFDKDKFVNALKGQFRSFLYSRMKRKYKKPKTKE